MFRTIMIAGVAGLSILAPAEPAAAQSVEIAIDPAELSSEDGVAALYSRIHRRARAACESMSDLHRLSDRNACRAALVDGIVGQVGHPALSALAESGRYRMAGRDRGTLIAARCGR